MSSIRKFALKVWANTFAKEFILSVIGAVAIQLAFGLNEAVGFIGTSKDWGELLKSGTAWAGALSFRLVQTALTQGAVFLFGKLGGRS